jgi:hypothetical protein
VEITAPALIPQNRNRLVASSDSAANYWAHLHGIGKSVAGQQCASREQTAFRFQTKEHGHAPGHAEISEASLAWPQQVKAARTAILEALRAHWNTHLSSHVECCRLRRLDNALILVRRGMNLANPR